MWWSEIGEGAQRSGRDLRLVTTTDDQEVTVQNTISDVLGSVNLTVVITLLIVLIAIVVVYLVFMVRAVIDMLRHDVHGVLLTFAFLALIPVPPILVMGLMILIIWHYHKRDILARERRAL